MSTVTGNWKHSNKNSKKIFAVFTEGTYVCWQTKCWTI